MPGSRTSERDGHVLIISINRTDRMNSLDGPAHFELSEMLDACESDPERLVAILTGAGEKAFRAGFST